MVSRLLIFLLLLEQLLENTEFKKIFLISIFILRSNTSIPLHMFDCNIAIIKRLGVNLLVSN